MSNIYCPKCGPISSTVSRTGVDLSQLPPGPIPHSKCGTSGEQLYAGKPPKHASGHVIDHKTYSRYSKPLEKGMWKVASSGQAFESALKKVASKNPSSALVISAIYLATTIAESPEAGAAGIYSNVSKYVDMTKFFLDKWTNDYDDTDITELMFRASRMYDDLLSLQNSVESTPPEILSEIKKSLIPILSLTKFLQIIFLAVVVILGWYLFTKYR